MKNIINTVCLPIVLIGALNYGLVGIFDYDLFARLLSDSMLVKIAHVIIGVAGVGLATGWYGKK